MNMFEAVIFDFDGVLVDSEVISLSELNRTLETFGIGKRWDELVNDFLGYSSQTIVNLIEQQIGTSPGQEFPELWAKRVFARFLSDLKLIPGAFQLLEHLDKSGIPYCIASGSSPERLQYSLELVGLTKHFEGKTFSGEMVGRGKPAPDIFLYAAEKLGVPPNRCLVIEDGVAGTIGATTAQIAKIIGFVGGSHLKGCEDGHADRLAQNGASTIVSSLREIEALLSDCAA